ncbi:mechanosensitive ion channel [Uliginosibacterium sp. 31-16]|uniref:mechanosensitive ion channel family protein n=1 Tax=Uliginosibacterium sp. 31-16 TaxID=3068315 RepID=UPI00273D05B0|nr:mechanosensitive ion channel domain-containing protein [Uliginosibacterium sp. 31-16]MDP5239871.1 mechanosensitive ion channel [Uliginosibacterium sp. 31-16]
MDGLLTDVLVLLTTPASLRELLVLAALLALAVLLARGLRSKVNRESSVGGLRSLAFPLLAILLLSALRFVAHHNGWKLHFVAVAVQLLWAMVGIRMVVFAVQRAFPKSPWVTSFGRSIAALVWLGVALDLLGILPELIQWLDTFVLPLGKTHITLWGVCQGLASVLGALVLALWLGGVIEARLLQVVGMDRSVQIVLSRVVKALLILIAVLVGMELVGLDITTLSVFGGALGVGLGFGMQKIASNYVSGFIILLDHSIRLGDVIQVGSDRGEVMQITTRYTVLRAGSGSHFLLPNETLVGSVVINDSFADPRVRVAVKVQVAYQSDVERALQILEELPLQEARVIADPAPKAFLVSFDDSGMTLELGFWINDPEKGSLEIRSNINRAILRRFREEGIEIPFPQREVRLLNPA